MMEVNRVRKWVIIRIVAGLMLYASSVEANMTNTSFETDRLIGWSAINLTGASAGVGGAASSRCGELIEIVTPNSF